MYTSPTGLPGFGVSLLSFAYYRMHKAYLDGIERRNVTKHYAKDKCGLKPLTPKLNVFSDTNLRLTLR